VSWSQPGHEYFIFLSIQMFSKTFCKSIINPFIPCPDSTNDKENAGKNVCEQSFFI